MICVSLKMGIAMERQFICWKTYDNHQFSGTNSSDKPISSLWCLGMKATDLDSGKHIQDFAMLCSHSWADAPRECFSECVGLESIDGFILESHLEHLISGIGYRLYLMIWFWWLKHQGYVDLSWPVRISTPPSISAVFWRYSFQTAIQNGPPRVSRVPLVLSSEIGQMGYWKQ